MPKLKNNGFHIKRTPLSVVGAVLILLLAALLLWYGNANSSQAIPALVAQVYFDGEYRIADGPWQKIAEGQHISSTQGDVTLRGNFHMLTPDGEYVGIYAGDMPIAFYVDHIALTFYEAGNPPYAMDMENPLYGDSACGESWTAHYITSEEPLEILIHNPHNFGNENAIDEMLAGVAIWTGVDFEKTVLKSGEAQRNTGIFFVIVSLAILGIALFSSLIHNKSSGLFWLLGLVILFAGLYFLYSAGGISFWQESVVSNTVVLGGAMMLYMLFLTALIVSFLVTTKKVGRIAAVCLGAVDGLLFVLPMATEVLFYNTWRWWVAVQLAVNLVLIGCLIKECFGADKKDNWLYIGVILPLIAFGTDAVMTELGVWKGGIVSQYIFVVLFAVAMVVVLRIIPGSINAAEKAKELELQRSRLEAEKNMVEAELKESRVAIMLSQIRPHFIYNTLGSIEQLCELDPPKAGELVHNFAKYLRGNFGELDNPKPILMSQEMEHVRHYIHIENVRFPDMTFSFEMRSEDFRLPALTVQPIVENAIKHGLMKLQKGGTIRVTSYETDMDYCICVEDNGIGFDTGKLLDDKKHIGIRNIRDRLKVMVGGKLEIESTPGVGTKVLITIPKEGQA